MWFEREPPRRWQEFAKKGEGLTAHGSQYRTNAARQVSGQTSLQIQVLSADMCGNTNLSTQILNFDYNNSLRNSDKKILWVETVDGFDLDVVQHVGVRVEGKLRFHVLVRVRLGGRHFQVGLHRCEVGSQGCVHVSFGLVDDDWSRDLGLTNLSIDINDRILLL